MAKVAPVPPGHDRIIAHLVVKNAAEAIVFYQKAFGAKEIMRMPGPHGCIMHAELRIGPSILFLADEFPGMTRSPQSLGGSPVTLALYCEDPDAVYNKAVAAGAKATMPLMNAFWGDRYGKLTDPSGHEWAIVSHLEDVTPEEMARRGQEWTKNMKM
ncbi:MAG: VOC family protein [Planctomycetes bacterium]|nr:VOC family protein [Planctomycetota bacterium]